MSVRRACGAVVASALLVLLTSCSNDSTHPGDPPSERDAAAVAVLDELEARVAAGDPLGPSVSGIALEPGCHRQFRDVHTLAVRGFDPTTTVSSATFEMEGDPARTIPTETVMRDGRTVCALVIDVQPDGTGYRDRFPAVLFAIVADPDRDVELRCVYDCAIPLFESNSPSWTYDGPYRVVFLPAGNLPYPRSPYSD